MRTLSIERIYNLGEYQSLRVTDTIEVPNGLEFDTKAIDLLRKLQYLSVDRVNQRYILHRKHLYPITDDMEKLAKIDEDRASVMDELLQLINKENKE